MSNFDETPPPPPRIVSEGEQGISGEVITENVTASSSQTGFAGVFNGLSNEGGKSLGGATQSRIIAATVTNIERQNIELGKELKFERELRINAELKLAEIKGQKSGNTSSSILGGIITILGSIFLALGITNQPTLGVAVEPGITSLGVLCILGGQIIPFWGRRSKT